MPGPVVRRAAPEDAGRLGFVGPAAYAAAYGYLWDDAAAFARFPLSVGVANVREHLPRLPVAPAFVTEADRGRGFAELGRLLLEPTD